MPRSEKTSNEQSNDKSVWSSLLEGLRYCYHDAFLSQYLFIWATVTLAVNGAYGLSTMYLQSDVIGMEQGNASVCRAVWFMALLCGSALSASLMRSHSVQLVHKGALVVMSASWALAALGGVFPHRALLLFWSFGVVTFGPAQSLSDSFTY